MVCEREMSGNIRAAAGAGKSRCGGCFQTNRNVTEVDR